MKKLFPFVLVLILCFSLAGCGGAEKNIDEFLGNLLMLSMRSQFKEDIRLRNP